MIWVYALAERPDLPVPRRRGLAQAPLEGVEAGPLLAVVTRHEHTPAEPSPDALWTHERVVERVMADRTVLPMRFGTVLADDEALRDAVRAREPELRAALDRLRGRVELGVRVLGAASTNGDGPAPDATGRDYVMARLARDDGAARLHAPLASLAVAERRTPVRGDGEVLRAAYLVDRRDVARFTAAVGRLQRQRPELSILCTGPWPPYGFVGSAA